MKSFRTAKSRLPNNELSGLLPAFGVSAETIQKLFHYNISSIKEFQAILPAGLENLGLSSDQKVALLSALRATMPAYLKQSGLIGEEQDVEMETQRIQPQTLVNISGQQDILGERDSNGFPGSWCTGFSFCKTARMWFDDDDLPAPQPASVDVPSPAATTAAANVDDSNNIQIAKTGRLKSTAVRKNMASIDGIGGVGMTPGTRVVRGLDWIWDDQDGGEGMVGTLVDVKADGSGPSDGIVSITWDNGAMGKYRVGHQASYDLLIYDCGPIGQKQGVACNECQRDVIGMRWGCSECPLTSLCTPCYMSDKHNLNHIFERFDCGDSKPVIVPARAGSEKIEAKGNFPGSIVVRGPDWEWDDQDGGEGQVGKVTEIEAWSSKSRRSVARVQWMKTGVSNVYRIGHKGKVDIKCVQPGSGGYYYKTHLPRLGFVPASSPPLMTSLQGDDHVLNFQGDVQIGEQVRVIYEKDVLKTLQNGHGGWNPKMEQEIGKVGVVQHITDKGDIVVYYEDTKAKWTFNPAAVTRVPKDFKEGDTIQLMSNVQLAKLYFQQDVGEWTDEFSKILGISGKVTKVYLDGNMKLAIGNTSWIISPRMVQCKVVQIPTTAPISLGAAGPSSLVVGPEVPGDVNVRPKAQRALPVVTAKAKVEGRLLQAAKEGELEEVKEILEVHPNEVNTPALEETPLLAAVVEEREDVVNYLMQHGADVNIKDKNNHTAVHLALSIGNDRIIEAVLNTSDLDCDVLDGKYKLDYLQFAAVCGSLRGIEILVKKFPHLKKRPCSGPTPVHYAVVSSKQLMEFLVTDGGYDVNCVDLDRRTPLHIAILSMNYDSARFLVRLNSDLNSRDIRGNTVLHMLMSPKERQTLREHNWYAVVMKRYLGRRNEQKVLNAQVLEEICNELDLKHNTYPTDAILACWLIQCGANPVLTNNQGKTSFDLCFRSDVMSLVRRFYERIISSRQKSSLDDNITSLNSQSAEASECKLCRESEANAKFSPCSHISVCVDCAEFFKKCMECNGSTKPNSSYEKRVQMLRASLGREYRTINKTLSTDRKKENQAVDGFLKTGQAPDCLICDTNYADVIFEPCKHMVVCQGCSWRLKRCVYCKKMIENMKNKDGVLIDIPVYKAEESKYVNLLETLKSLETKVRDMEVLNTCTICLDRPKNVVFLCGHGTCATCSTSLDSCPICRSSIEKKIVLFQ